MEPEFNFQLSQSERTKKAYMGKWQLHTRFKDLDKCIENSLDTNFIIGHSLPLSLHDYARADYVVASKASEKETRDEIHVYAGFLRNISYHLKQHPRDISSVLDYLERGVWDLAVQIRETDFSSDSKIFSQLFIDSSFSLKKNPSGYLAGKGKQIYDAVIAVGPLSGDRLIVSRNYDSILKSK